MKLTELLNESADYTKFDINSLVDAVKDILKKDNQSTFVADVTGFKKDSKFDGAITATFSVPFVDSINGSKAEQGQNTSAQLNKILDQPYRDFKAQGLIFTQPLADKTKSQESEKFLTGFITFTIGIK